MYKDLEQKKEEIKNFLIKNPHATHRSIRKNLKIHLERVYPQGLEEVYNEAKIDPPKKFKKRSDEDKKQVIINYIKEHPGVGGHTIRKDTKINFSILFSSIVEAYKEAGVKYPREVDHTKREDKIEKIIKVVKNNPSLTIPEIAKITKTNPYNFFEKKKDIYKIAKIDKKEILSKRKIAKRQEVINFIKENTKATQREINKFCRVHVQELFKKGIFGAYKEAGVKFPYERLSLYGAVLKEIRNKAKNFEEEVAVKLSGYGRVNRLVKTKRGFADMIFERKDKKVIIEVKDYENKDISISQVKQLNKYLEDCDCHLGFLICKNKPKKDRFLIGKNKINILEISEINKIPDLMMGV